MYYLDLRRKEDFAAARANGGAEVHVLGVHEIALVEPAHGVRVGAPDQQTRAAYPVGILPLPRERLDRAALRAPLLEKLVQRADHAPERQLGASGAIHEARSGDRDVRVTIELGQQPVDGACRNDRVAVQEQEIRTAAGANADV